jgi:hypothetical protein
VTTREPAPLRSRLAQLALPLAGLLRLGRWRDPVPPVAGHDDAVFVRHPRARRYVLRLTEDGRPRVTIPRRGSRREAEAFLRRQADWVARQRERLRAAQAQRGSAWQPGGAIWLRGVPTPVLAATRGDGVELAGQPVRLGRDGEVAAALKRHLRALAARELPERTRALAAREGVPVSRVTVRDQRSRWGSCSPGGRISLNWRLLQMPPEVADYVILHELMHVREPNHSRRFWALVLRACPGAHEARRWIRRHGAELL